MPLRLVVCVAGLREDGNLCGNMCPYIGDPFPMTMAHVEVVSKTPLSVESHVLSFDTVDAFPLPAKRHAANIELPRSVS